jgi:hypothetical protein
MLKYLVIIIAGIILCPNLKAQKQEVWMVGPMLHFNFGNKEIHTSFGIELSYWNYDNFPYSFNGALEFEKKKIRLYGEAQCGIAVAGLSMGPVMEFRTDEGKLKLGLQGSVWGNYFLGFDLRYRYISGGSVISPGVYVKLPVGIGDSETDHHDWDWDD